MPWGSMPQARLLLLGAGAAKSARIDTHMKEKETEKGKVWLEYPGCREAKSGVLSVPQAILSHIGWENLPFSLLLCLGQLEDGQPIVISWSLVLICCSQTRLESRFSRKANKPQVPLIQPVYWRRGLALSWSSKMWPLFGISPSQFQLIWNNPPQGGLAYVYCCGSSGELKALAREESELN